ncbi:MAG: hypothetical protein Aurels2KO_57850 [Aureliella sp.]
MEKTIYSGEYTKVIELIRDLREKSGLTQVEVAERLGITQSFVSKVERGERVLDVIQLRTFCFALGTTLPAFVRKLEKQLESLR